MRTSFAAVVALACTCACSGDLELGTDSMSQLVGGASAVATMAAGGSAGNTMACPPSCGRSGGMIAHAGQPNEDEPASNDEMQRDASVAEDDEDHEEDEDDENDGGD